MKDLGLGFHQVVIRSRFLNRKVAAKRMSSLAGHRVEVARVAPVRDAHAGLLKESLAS